jgi:hypothetical protein
MRIWLKFCQQWIGRGESPNASIIAGWIADLLDSTRGESSPAVPEFVSVQDSETGDICLVPNDPRFIRAYISPPALVLPLELFSTDEVTKALGGPSGSNG